MNRGFGLRERAQGNLGLFLLCAILLLVPLAIWPGVALEPFKAHLAELCAAVPVFIPRPHWRRKTRNFVLDSRAVPMSRVSTPVPLCLTVAVSSIRHTNRPVRHSLWRVSLLCLVCSWAWSTIASLYPAWSFWGGPDRGRGFVLFAACLACLRVARRANLGRIWALRTVIGISGGIAAWYAALQALGGDPFHWALHPHAIGSTFANSSFLRDWLAVALLVTLAEVKGTRKVVTPLLGLALILFVVWTGTSRWPSMHYRIAMWQAVGSQAASIPLLGYGPDMGAWVLTPWARDAVQEYDRTQDRTENLLLDTLVERGWLGLAAELLFWGCVLWTGRRSVYLPALLCCLALACLSVLSVPSQVLAYVLAGLVLSPFTAAARGADQSHRSEAGVQIAIGDLREGGPAITTQRDLTAASR